MMRALLALWLSITAAQAQTQDQFVRALQSLRPGAQWSLSGTSCGGLVWLDQIQTAPTCAQINTAITAAPAVPVPSAVTRMQLLVALSRAGQLTAMQTWLATQSAETQLIWNNLPEFPRNAAIVNAAGAALSLTNTQLDQLFITAAGINP